MQTTVSTQSHSLSTLMSLRSLAVGARNNSTALTLIVGHAGHGLCNNLGVIAFGLYFAQAKHIDTVAFYWYSEDHFLELFQPIPNLVFINREDEYNFLRSIPNFIDVTFPEYKFDPIQDVIPMTTEQFRVAQMHVYSKYVLTYQNELEVSRFVETHSVCDAIAIHVRKTDFGEGSPDEEYMEFVDSFDEKPKVFILTDNGETQRKFVHMIGTERSLVYEHIPLDKGLRRRHTSIEQAGKEMMIATYAKAFCGTSESTFSETIEIFRRVHEHRRLSVCHRLPPPTIFSTSAAILQSKLAISSAISFALILLTALSLLGVVHCVRKLRTSLT